MNSDALTFRPTIFLDTNALQFVSSYLRHAEKLGLPPFKGVGRPDYEKIQTTLREKLPRGVVDSIMKGCRTLAFLQELAGDDEISGDIYASRLSRAELLFGILDGQAHARLAREGLSYRMRQRLRDLSELVSRYLERQDYEDLLQEVNGLFEMLKEKDGIRIEWVEESISDFSSITVFSELLQSNVFLDVLDCWMYGCAVAIQAEKIITFDNYFKRVINRIHNAQGEEDWLYIQSIITDELERLNPVASPVTLSLPAAFDPPRTAPSLWEADHA
ncbi:MAG: hypothetical protein GXP42_17490 [Chloroflexi bacterium]|nr:hypothetical protein [Chloroflexota bacterium]